MKKEKSKKATNSTEGLREYTNTLLRAISRDYGISPKELGSFVEEKRTRGPFKEEYEFSVVNETIGQIFDQLLARLLTNLEALGTIGPEFVMKDDVLSPIKGKNEARRKIFKTIVREAQNRIKNELELSKEN